MTVWRLDTGAAIRKNAVKMVGNRDVSPRKARKEIQIEALKRRLTIKGMYGEKNSQCYVDEM